MVGGLEGGIELDRVAIFFVSEVKILTAVLTVIVAMIAVVRIILITIVVVLSRRIPASVNNDI